MLFRWQRSVTAFELVPALHGVEALVLLADICSWRFAVLALAPGSGHVRAPVLAFRRRPADHGVARAGCIVDVAQNILTAISTNTSSAMTTTASDTGTPDYSVHSLDSFRIGQASTGADAVREVHRWTSTGQVPRVVATPAEWTAAAAIGAPAVTANYSRHAASSSTRTASSRSSAPRICFGELPTAKRS